MSHESTLRWGLLSTALINRSLIPPLRELEHNEVAAIASRTYEKAKDFSEHWNIPKVFGSYEALLADQGIDVVYIPLPNSLHAEWTVKAANASKHILCEKPLAITVEEVDQMTAAAHQAGVVLAEALMYRHHPQTLKAKELIQEGVIGKLCLIRGTFNYPLREGKNIRLDPNLGGGCLWDIGYYPISFARYVVGLNPIEAFGWQVTSETGVDRTFIGQLRFPEEIYAQIDCSFQHPSQNSMEFVGSEGTLRINSAFMRSVDKEIHVFKGNQIEKISVDTNQHRYLGEVKDMYEAIKQSNPQRITHEESRGNVATVNALLRSALEARIMEV